MLTIAVILSIDTQVINDDAGVVVCIQHLINHIFRIEGYITTSYDSRTGIEIDSS
jgi:hypothetical protein